MFNVKIVAFLAFILSMSWLGYQLYNKIEQSGYNRAQTEYTKKTLELITKNKEIEQQAQVKVNEANKAIQKTSIINATTASATRIQSDSLRNDLDAIRSNLPRLALDASNRYADTLSIIFNECQAKYSELAATADQIQSDKQALVDSW